MINLRNFRKTALARHSTGEIAQPQRATATRRRYGAAVAIIALTTAWATLGFAQERYPARPIRFIVPYPAGGAADTQARELGRRLADALGQPVIIDNRGGGSGNIGTLAIARSKPDGYTIGMAASPMVLANALYKTSPFDPLKEFAPISLFAKSPNVILAGPGLPANSLAELVKLSKSGTTQLSYAGGAPLFQLASELIKRQAKLEMIGVQYKGTAEARADLMTGRVSIMIEAVGSAKSAIESGQLKALGVLSRTRNPHLPTVPTLQEQGFSGLEVEGWVGVMAPAGTPDDIIHRLNAEITTILRGADMQQKLDSLGFIAFPGTPDEMKRLLAKDLEMYRVIAKDAGIEQQ